MDAAALWLDARGEGRVGRTGTAGLNELTMLVGQLSSAIGSTFTMLAFLVVTAAGTWLLFRRLRRKPLHPDVGTVSTQWIAHHRATNRDHAR